MCVHGLKVASLCGVLGCWMWRFAVEFCSLGRPVVLATCCKNLLVVYVSAFAVNVLEMAA